MTPLPWFFLHLNTTLCENDFWTTAETKWDATGGVREYNSASYEPYRIRAYSRW
jgi:hypothetical protein